MANPVSSVLFVDDDADVRKAAALLLSRHGFTVSSAASPAEAWSIIAAAPIDVVLLDLNFGPGAVSGSEGLQFLGALIAHDPDAVVVVVTGHSGITIAVAAMRAGAADFVMKPWNNDRLLATLRGAAQLRARRRDAHAAGPAHADPADAIAPMICDSPPMQRVQALASRVAATEAAVLLLGEPGTGKTLLAHFIHRHSSRAAFPLTTLDPMALWSEGEAALAVSLAAADPRGSLLLDGLGGWPLSLQARLATWLETNPAPRLLAASRHSYAELRSGMIGADLLCRLGTVDIPLPPLRDRGDDAGRLADHFLALFARRHNRPALSLGADARAAIATAPWPDNVRELRQAIERAVVLATAATLAAEDVLPTAAATAIAGTAPQDTDLNLARSERAVVQAALRRHGFNVTQAARELGVTRATLYRRMARHGF